MARGGFWTTNWPVEASKAQVMRQVAAQVRAGQMNRVTTAAGNGYGPFRDGAQVEAFRNLQQRVGPSLEVYLRPENSTPVQIKGSPLAKAGANAGAPEIRDEAMARVFLRDNAGLLLLDDPGVELRLAKRDLDPLGGATLRFTQQYQGLAVWPAELGVHLDAGGNINMVDGAYVATPNAVDVAPKLTAAEAEVKARASLADGQEARVTVPDLVVYAPVNQKPRLAWKMAASAALDRDWWIVIDGQDGSVLATISRVASGSVPGSGVDLLGVNRSLMVWQSGSTYYMVDASKPMFNPSTGDGVIETDDARGATESQILVDNTIQNLSFVSSSAPTSWGNPDAVSAAYNLGQTYDYYADRFSRKSYDGNGGNIGAVVRIGSLANAFWNNQHKMMFFGNADRYAGSLDVIGHEVTHGVIFSIGSQGVLMYTGQSGALDEAFADIFGEMIEARTKGTNDWVIGSQLMTAVRNMANPAAYGQPGRMAQYVVTRSDNGGVHANSGIINRAYFLLAAGLKGAIGNRDAERVFYRCLTTSMKPLSEFVDARLGCVAAAEALFGVGSAQALKTAEAFDGVEIYAAPVSAPQPDNVNAAVQGPESALFIREHWFYNRDDLWRAESAQGDPSNGSSLVTNVRLTRPSVTGDGTETAFAGADESLCIIATGGTNFNTGYAGKVHSVSASPEGHYVAFVFDASPGVPTNRIVLLDLWSNVTATVNLVTPVSDGPPLSNVSYADALSFSPDGKILFYDAVSSIRTASGQLRHAWSIFGLDMATLQQQVIVPPDDQFDIGNPACSKTSSRFLAFEAQYTNGNSAVLTLDLYQGTLGLIGVSSSGLGYPIFNGNDNYLCYADQDGTTISGRSVYAQALTADRMGPSGSRSLMMRDAKLLVTYRRGIYPNVNTAPSVALTSPSPNSIFTAPATITLSASASDLNGTVARVEFYTGGTLLATDSAAPYSYTWSNLPAGVYTVYARAYDNQGASCTTPPVRFTVKPPIQPGVLNAPGAPGFELALKLPQAGVYRLEASTNLVDWVPLTSFYCSTNLSFLDSGATNFSRRFYRAVSSP